MTWETRYRPAYKWLWYLCEGWDIAPMLYHHQRWVLVSKRVR